MRLLRLGIARHFRLFFCIALILLEVGCATSPRSAERTPSSDRSRVTSKGKLAEFTLDEIFGSRIQPARSPFQQIYQGQSVVVIDLAGLLDQPTTKLECPDFKKAWYMWPVGTLRLSFFNEYGSEIRIEDEYRSRNPQSPEEADKLSISIQDHEGNQRLQTIAHEVHFADSWFRVGNQWIQPIMHGALEGQEQADENFIIALRANLTPHLLGICYKKVR